MVDAEQKLEGVAEEAKEVAAEVVSSGLWKKYKAVRVGVFLLVGAATAGSFAYGYIHQASAAAPLETQAHANDEHLRLDKKIDALGEKLPDAVAKKVVEALKGRR